MKGVAHEPSKPQAEQWRRATQSTTMHELAGSPQRVVSPDVTRRALDRARAGSLAVDAALVSAVALVLGLIRLGSQSLWIDETLTAWEITWRYSRSLEGLYWLYYSVEKPWAAIAGYSESALRFPSVVATMVSGVLLVILARRLFDRRVALVSGLFLVTNPFVVKWSQQARGYTMLLALSLLATILLVRALERGSRGAFALYGLSFAAVVVMHPVGGLVLALPHLVLMAQRRERLLPHGLLAAAIVLAIGVPWTAQVTMRSTGGNAVMSWLPFPSFEAVARAVLEISGAGWFGIVLAVVGLLVLWRAQHERAIWLGVWAFSPFAVALVVSLHQPIFLDRYLIAAAPAFALLAAIAVTGVARRLGVTLVVLAVAATTIVLIQWYTYPASANWRGEDWRAASELVSERRAPGDAVIVVPWWPSAPRYYGVAVEPVATGGSVWVLSWSEKGGRLSVAERTARGFGDHRLVERHDFGWRLSAQLWKRPGTP